MAWRLKKDKRDSLNRAGSIEISGGNMVPGTLTLENEIANFAYGTPPAAVSGDEMSIGKNLFNCVRGSSGESDPAHDRDVDHVISHKTDLRIGQAGILDNAAIHSQLVKCSLKNEGDCQFRRTVGDHLRLPAGNDSDLYPRSLQKLNAMPVLDVEKFTLDTVGIENDAAIGEHTINIEEEQFYVLSDVQSYVFPKGTRFLRKVKAVEGLRGGVAPCGHKSATPHKESRLAEIAQKARS